MKHYRLAKTDIGLNVFDEGGSLAGHIERVGEEFAFVDQASKTQFPKARNIQGAFDNYAAENARLYGGDGKAPTPMPDKAAKDPGDAENKKAEAAKKKAAAAAKRKATAAAKKAAAQAAAKK